MLHPLPKDSQCLTCRHFKGIKTGKTEKEERYHCSAFDQIPDLVLINKLDHTKPIDGDGGVQYEKDQG
jgi:hypothetical protein